jgi:hypothetical protein
MKEKNVTVKGTVAACTFRDTSREEWSEKLKASISKLGGK